MITLYSYPELFGVADNNPYGLKIFAFLRLCRIPFDHRHILEVSGAPRAQLPYIDDGGTQVGDSDEIIAYLIHKYGLSIDASLTPAQQQTDVMLRRTLDDLYWVMSYSRWQDDQFWPSFRDVFLRAHPEIAKTSLEAARQHNFKRYYFQGVGRYEPGAVYGRGLADLRAIASLMPETGYVFGPGPCSADASIYGFFANIYFYETETPLKIYAAACPRLTRHCLAVHAAISSNF
jgi:glutathione S-transferase